MNQFKSPLLSIVCIILLCTCDKQEKNTENIKGLNLLLDRYYSVNYDYPKAKKEFVSFCKNDSYSKERLLDTLEIIINFIEKHRITWSLEDGSFPDQSLVILSERDTIVYRNNNWRFPCIGYYNDAFVNSYLREPYTLSEFLLFCDYCDSVSEKEFWPYRKCDSITIMNLRKCLELTSTQWVQDHERLFLIIDHDTLWDHQTASPCTKKNEIMVFDPHYYNKHHIAVDISDELDKGFRLKLRDLSMQHQIKGAITSNQFHILEFDYLKGLKPFCENDTIHIDKYWFLTLEQYLQDFAAENELEKIVFSLPIVE